MPDPSGLETWERRDKPALLHRRFQFGGYSETRAFLDRMAQLSERHGYYPDTSFGATYVNVTIHARNGERLGEDDEHYAIAVNALLASKP